MNETVLKNSYRTDTDNRKLTVEQIKEGKKHLEHEFERILRTDPDENFYWVGSMTDLIELVYIVYADGIVRDNMGYPITMRELVKRVCANLHVCEPCNPYSVAVRARNRKGIIHQPFIERYSWLLFMAEVEHPLNDEIVCLSV